jgi:hypothetical protein
MFSMTLLEEWITDEYHPLRVILISSEDSTVVKFHIVRENEDWLGENLEEDVDGVLAATKSDLLELRTLVSAG